jgi:Major capsid protein N-terminus/Large eukaryotic DNA virus major capsid protein
MGGSLLQLVAKGADDVYLIKDPQVTMFRVVYRRHTNFSIFDLIKKPKAKNTFGIDFQNELDKVGDALHKIYLIVKLPKLNLKNLPPTCDNVKKLLAEYGIPWITEVISNYNVVTDTCPSIVTLQYYNEQLIQVINAEIRKNADLYNFYANGNILSTSAGYLKRSSQAVLSRALDSTFNYVFAQGDGLTNFAEWGDMIKQISLFLTERKLSNGVVGSLMLLTKMLTRYSEEYSSVYSSKYFPNLLNNRYSVADDEYGVKKFIIMMFSEQFRQGFDTKLNSNIIFNTGMLLQMLLNYYYDTTILNINGNTSDVNHGTIKLEKNKFFTSSPLFGELLNRPPNRLENELIDFQLYDAKDIQNIYYISLMYNLTRLRIDSQLGPYEFNLDHGVIYSGDLLPPLNEPDLLGMYNPYVTHIDDNIIFYHVLDPNLTDYTVTSVHTGENIGLHFNDIIQGKYTTFETYNEIFPFNNNSQYTDLDSYKIYFQYIAQILSSGSEDVVVRDTTQIEGLASLILFYIQYNVQYNLALVRNMMDVINFSKFDNESHYRFTYYKQYRQNGQNFTQTNPTLIVGNSTFRTNSDEEVNSFTNVDQFNLNDQFERRIRSNQIINGEYFLTINGRTGTEIIPNKTPGGADVTNFFSNQISSSIETFRTTTDQYIKDFESLGYMTDFTLWQRGLFDLGNKIQETYSFYAEPTDPQFAVPNSFSEQYKRIAIMNYIPFLSARDVPDMIYYLFSTIPKIREVLGGLFSDFLDVIDYRDSGDNGAPLLDPVKEITKKDIYQRLIHAVIGTDTGVLIDGDHFNQVVDTFSGGNFLLGQSFRPESLFTEYSIDDASGKLTDPTGDSSFDANNISYLPLEWLTQTYYHIFLNKITDFFNANSLSQTDSDNFILLLKSIINCYVVYENPSSIVPSPTDPTFTTFPPYSTYQQNGYIFLGLFPETSLAPAEYLIRLQDDYFVKPTYSDSTATVWYQLFKKNILSYNKLYNHTLLSDSYYKNNIGKSMADIFDFFKHTVNGDRSFSFSYNKEEIKDASIQTIGTIENADIKNIESISVHLNGSSFGGEIDENLEERIILNFNSSSTGPIGVLKNHLIDFNVRRVIEYDETYEVPSDAENCVVSYINNPGYQIYFNMLVFLNGKNNYFEPGVNVYIDKILDTYDGLTNEQYPPIEEIETGYDFYRLRNFDTINKYTGKTKYVEITNFINDNITLFNNNLKHYTDNILLLEFSNDTELIYNDGNQIVTRKNEDFIYEESEKICEYLNEHITTKYISEIPLTSVSNQVTTVDTSTHPISDLIPKNPQGDLSITNTDIIGFSFTVSGQVQNDYSIGFAVGPYPYTQNKIQIRKIGNNFYLFLTNTQLEITCGGAMPANCIPITISPTENTKYHFIQNNITKTLDVYENNTHIINIDTSNPIYASIISSITENFIFYVDGSITVQFWDIYTILNGPNSIPLQTALNSTTKWFYAGTDTLASQNFTSYIQQQQILHTVYFENNESLSLDQFTTQITTQSSSEHPFGQTIYSPQLLNSSDIFGFAFTVLNDTLDLGIGIFGNDGTNYGSIIIQKNSIILEYGGQTTINLSQELSFTTDNIYYFFYNNSSSTLQLYEITLITDPVTNEITITETFNVTIVVTDSVPGMVNLFSNNMNFYLMGSSYIRYYMDRYAYQFGSDNTKNIMKTINKWYDIGGTYTIPFITDISQIIHLSYTSTINDFNPSSITQNEMEQIAPGKNNFNDIVFSGGINLLTFSRRIDPQIISTDIIGYAFSILDNSSSEVGIGLGVDGYFSNRSIQMYRVDTNNYINITDDGENYDQIPFIQNPIYDESDIYYCFQDNNTKQFTVYESKNIDPLVTISVPDSQKYATLADMLQHSANLFITGKTTVKFYTAKFAYTQTTSTVKQLIKNVTKWFYTGAEDITPFTSAASVDESLININYRNHTGFLDEGIVKNLNAKRFYINQLENINQSINPNAYNNVHNLNGIHGTVENSKNEEKNIAYNTAIYGIIDSFYNNHLTGNMDSTFKLSQLDLPIGKIYTDFITNDDNPFYSYSLYDHFISSSSEVNYDNYKFKNNNKTLIPSNLLTYNDSKEISKMFDNVIHQCGETIHVLEDLKYVKEPTFINSKLSTITLSETTRATITTTDQYEHLFSTNNNSIVGFAVTSTQFFGCSFIIENILSDQIEVGVSLNPDNNETENKIVIRKNGLNYDVLFQYTFSGSTYRQTFLLDQKPNFNSSNTYTFFVFNSNVPQSTINTINNSITDASEKVSKHSVQIYENFTLIFNKVIDPGTIYINLFMNSNAHLFVNGQMRTTYLSKSQAVRTSNTVIRNIINAGTIWFSMNETTSPFVSVINYSFKNADTRESNRCSITISEPSITEDYIFVPNAETNNNDIIGIAFEFINTPTNVSIGFGHFETELDSRLQIQKNGTIYSLNVNNIDNFPLLNNIEFKPGSIYLCIQNNKDGKFSIYRYKDAKIDLVYQITFLDSNEYERLTYSEFSHKLNILVTTNSTAKINFYTAKYMFNLSSLNNQILIGDLTKWLYVGALDTDPITKIVLDPNNITHHKFDFGLTPGTEIYTPSLINPPIAPIPIAPAPPIAQLDKIIPSSIIKFDNYNYNDVILNDVDPEIKAVGTGVVKLFDPLDPTNVAKFLEYIGLTPGPTTFTKIYSMAFSVVNDASDFSVGFFSWVDTNIMFTKTGDSYSIIINYLEFIPAVNNEYKTLEIMLDNVNINSNTIFYAFQNNEDNTFTLYENNNLIIKITIDIPEYSSLLFQVAPPFYGTLKTICTLGVSGTNQTAIRFYSQRYIEQIAPVSIKNILQLKDYDNSDKIVWFGASTVENSNINNTSDNRIIGLNNNSIFLEPPVDINKTSVLPDDTVQIDSFGILGFSFTISDFSITDFNSDGLRIGLSDNTVLGTSNAAFSLIELQIFNNRLTVGVNNVEHFYSSLPTFAPDDMYYVFQDNNSKQFKIYENAKLIFSINTTDDDYNAIIDRLNNPIYLFLSGKMNVKIHNAPYAYLKATTEIKIMIDNCTKWLTLGGSNTGPIKQRKITSKKLYSDPNINSLFADPLKGPLSNFSLTSSYMYFEILRNSPIKCLNLMPFINLVTIDDNNGTTDNGYTSTVNSLNNYIKPQIKKYFDSLLKITSVNIRDSKPPESELFVNGFNTFLDNIYKVWPVDYYQHDLDNNSIQHVYYDNYYRTGFFDYQLDYKVTINYYMPSFTGRPNGIIESDLEERILKLIMNAPPKYSWVKELGHKIIKEVTVSIGDQVIETHDSNLFHLMHQFRVSPEQKRGYNSMIGNTLEMYQYSSDERSITTLYIPLYFWFCENVGNSLPMTALLHSRVMLNFKIEELKNLLYLEKDSYIYGTPKVEYSLMCQYAYLEEDERWRFANSKLEYLIEKYNYNGKNIISKNTSFSNEIETEQEIVETNTIDDKVVIYALKNLVYHIHILVTNDGTIESARTGELDFRETITRSKKDYQFSPIYGFSQKKIIGFSFQVISVPELNTTTGNYDPNLFAPQFGIGLDYSINEYDNNKITSKQIGSLELQKDYIVITDLETEKVSQVNYLSKPKFRGGVLVEIQDIYVCIQDNINEKFLVYENSILIAVIDRDTSAYDSILQFTKVGVQTIATEKLNLRISGPIRAFFYNAKFPYNNAKQNLRQEMDNITSWLYLGGDDTPITEIFNYQEVRIQSPPPTIDMTPQSYGAELEVKQNGNYVCQPAVTVTSNSLIGFSFSLDYKLPLLTYDLSIGLSIDGNDNAFIQMRNIGDTFDILISDGINTSSVEYIKDPIFYVQDKKFPTQNKLYRPNIIYTCIQDNISKTFTIFEENQIIGQITQTNNVYRNLIDLLSSNLHIKFNVDNLAFGPLLINFYTSQDLLENHSRLPLRRIINNITDWISFIDFNPTFYVPSFRNVSTKLIDDVSNKGTIENVTCTSSDVVTTKRENYLLRPSQYADVTQTNGFSFSILDPVPTYFEIGITQFSNISNKIVFKKEFTDVYLEITNTKTVSTLTNADLTNLSKTELSKMILGTTKQIVTTSRIELKRPLTFGASAIYTIAQDNTLGLFTLFRHEEIIGQASVSDVEYAKLLPGLRTGVNIILNGAMTTRFYSAEYIYNSLNNNLHHYMERIDRWYHVQKIITKTTTQIIPYEPTPVPIKVRMEDPIKYFVWYMKAYDDTTKRPEDIINWMKYGFNIRDKHQNYITIHPFVKDMKLQMYGVDRENPSVSMRSGAGEDNFTSVATENFYSHLVPWGRNCQSLDNGEFMYSFALYPMLLQPSGAANYSEVEDSRWVINLTNDAETMMRNNKNIRIELELWGRSINILRVASGMAGLLFYK